MRANYIPVALSITSSIVGIPNEQRLDLVLPIDPHQDYEKLCEGLKNNTSKFLEQVNIAPLPSMFNCRAWGHEDYGITYIRAIISVLEDDNSMFEGRKSPPETVKLYSSDNVVKEYTKVHIHL